jgi:Cu/Ag efflux pump CusA
LATLVIAVRGAILIVSRFQQLEDDGTREPGRDLVLHGTHEQFGAIVAAALTTAAFLIPFVVLGSPVGLEIVHPMAAVLLGGLATATFVTLFALPTLYARFAARTERDPADGLLQRWAGAEPAPASNSPASTVTAIAEGS